VVPLILIALGLGAALTIYELSPKTRVRVDDYVRAIAAAHASHRAAEVHLSNAGAATATAARHAQRADEAARQAVQPVPPFVPQPVPAATLAPAPMPTPTPVLVPPTPAPIPEFVPAAPPSVPPAPTPALDLADAQAGAAQSAADAAVEHVAAATEANQAAAKSTADAAKNAQTQDQRQAVAESAARVDATRSRIAEELRTLGIGQCGVRTYTRVTAGVKATLLAKLRAEGMGIAGNNPWNIDTRKYGVKLRAVWDPEAQIVKLIVTTGRGNEAIPIIHPRVTCEDIWDEIDPIMRGVGATRV